MKVPFFALDRQYRTIKTEIDQVVASVLGGGSYIGGAPVRQFEEMFADYLHAGHCIGVGNATDALELILRGMDIGEGDEVLVPAHTWISGAEVVDMVGAKPIFVDIHKELYTIDPTSVSARISVRTKAIIAVHLYGKPAPMDVLMPLAKEKGLRLIEDCAQAHGAMIGTRKVGSIGHAAAFSFYPTKNLGAYGDGGAIVTNDGVLARKCRLLANHGQPQRDKHELIGRNSRLDTLQAAILSIKLRFLDQWNGARANHALSYEQGLEDTGLGLPLKQHGHQEVHHIYPIRSPKRDELRAFLTKRGVGTAVHYPKAIPLTPAYGHRNFTKEDFPMAHQVSNEVLSLPIFPELNPQEVAYVIDTVRDWKRRE